MTQYLSQLSLAKLLAASLLLGIALGALYDLFRIRRLAFRRASKEPTHSTDPVKHRRLHSLIAAMLLHIEDALFGVAAGIATALLYFALSRGQVRLMAIFGEGVGFLLYRQTLGRLVMACADRILRLIAFLINLLVRFFLLPPIRLLKRILSAIGQSCRKAHDRRRRRRLDRIGGREALRYEMWLLRMASNGFSEDEPCSPNHDRITKSNNKNKG